jgi:O-antigen/teichoic acid export membrane protein
MGGILKNQTLKGFFWSAIERFSVQGIQFVLSIIIARLITPSDYGLIAMLNIFISLGQVFIDSGFSSALIQKKDRTDVDFSTVFYFNIVVSVLVYIVLFISAPVISSFYNVPELEIITKWISLGVIVSAFSIVQRAELTIKLDFRTQAKASLISVLISGVIGICFAYYGFGAWALVIQNLSSNLLNTLLLWFFSSWKPKLVYSWGAFNVLFTFGSKLLFSALLHTLYINLYSLVIGKKYSTTDVGYYNRAYSIAQFPSINIVGIISRVMYPIQCELQDEEEKLNLSFINYLRISCFTIFPMMVIVAVLSKPLVLFFLTEKWISVAELLSILCFAYMWYPVMVINNQILNVKGRSDYFLKTEVIKKVVAVIILLITMPLGIHILCWGVLLYNLLDILIIVFFAKKVIRTSYVEQLKNILPFFILSLIMGVAVYISVLIFTAPLYQLLLGLLVGLLSYSLLGCLFHLKEFLMIFNFIKRLCVR